VLGQLLGSLNKERALIYLTARENGYAREVARFYDAPLDPIQKALDGLERAGVLVSRDIGSARVYEFNRRYPLREELRALLNKVLLLYPKDRQEALLARRIRPRRKGIPL